MSRRDRSTEAAAVVLLLIALVFLAIAKSVRAAEQGDRDPLIKAQTDIVAARLCQARHFPLMARLGDQYVICLASRAGVPQDVRVVEVSAVLGKKP